MQFAQLSPEPQVFTSIISAVAGEQKTSMVLLLHLKLWVYLSALLILT